jgi:hypothetical protein
MGKHARILPGIFSLLLIAALTACTPSPSRKIDQAERKWQDQDITSYRIAVLHVQSIWHAQTNTITVREGEVVEVTGICIPAPFEGGSCTVEEVDPAEYLVPGLFETARRLVEHQPAEAVEITFDESYGFPKAISFNLPDVVDEDNYWEVKSFEVLED